MRSKKLISLVLIAIISVLLIIVSEHLTNSKPADKTLKLFNDKIGTFIVKKDGNFATIHKKGDTWVVSPGVKLPDGASSEAFAAEAKAHVSAPDYESDSATVAIAVEKLSSMKKGDLESKNPEKQAVFEVDTVKGMIIEAYNPGGKSLGAIIIGKSTPDWNSNYVRALNSGEVYRVTGGIGYSFFSEVERWRNKSMISFDKANAKSLSLVKKDGKAIDIVKADTGDTWSITSPSPCTAKKAAVEDIISSMSRLNAASFQDSVLQDSVLGFSKPELTVSVGLANSVKKLTIGAKTTDGKYYAMVDGKTTIYKIFESEFNDLNKDLSSLKDSTVQVLNVPAKTKQAPAKPAADK